MENDKFLLGMGVTAAVVVGAFVFWGPSGNQLTLVDSSDKICLHNYSLTKLQKKKTDYWKIFNITLCWFSRGQFASRICVNLSIKTFFSKIERIYFKFVH